MGGFEFVLIALAAVLGGAVNALAGGGTLITFPMLTAVGIPAVAATSPIRWRSVRATWGDHGAMARFARA